MRYFQSFITRCSVIALAFTVNTVWAKTDGTQNIDGRDGKTQERSVDGKTSPSKDGRTPPAKSGEQHNKNTPLPKNAPAEKNNPNQNKSNSSQNKNHSGHDNNHGDGHNDGGQHDGGHHGNNKYEYHHHNTINIVFAGHPGSDHGHWNHGPHGRYYHGYWHGYWVDQHWVWWRGFYGFWLPLGGISIFVSEAVS